MDLKNKQGDDDGEDTIREHFQASGFNEVAISGIDAVHLDSSRVIVGNYWRVT